MDTSCLQWVWAQFNPFTTQSLSFNLSGEFNFSPVIQLMDKPFHNRSDMLQ